MANTVKPIPEGFHTITPYIAAKGADKMLEFMKKAFGAQEKHLSRRADGSVWHGQVQIGDSMLMFTEGLPEWGGARPTALYLYLTDTDAAYKSAMAAGGKSLREPTDEMYGDRCAGVEDPVGNQWWLATHIKDVAPEDMKKAEKA